MVGNPGSSTRCLQCRQRKKKCGLEQPSCLRCVRSGLQCSGPGQTNVFINRNGSDLFQRTDKAALNAAFGSRHASPANLEVLDGLVTQSSSCILYDAIAAEFAPKPLTGIFSGDRSPDKVPYYSGIAKAVRALTGMASGCTNLLDLGVFTLLTKYYGTFQRDEALVDLANASYTKVLGLFHQRLVGVNTLLQYNSADHRSYQAAFYVCLTMQFFEMINWPPSEQALEIHVDGALAILEKLGPHLTQKVIDPRIFDSFRVMAISISLKRRRSLFLAQRQWQELAICGGSQTCLEQLDDIAIQIPALLEQTDMFVSQPSNIVVLSDLEALLQNYLDVLQSFDIWFERFSDARSERVYWSIDEDFSGRLPISVFDVVCQPSFPSQTYKLRFRDGATAGRLARYWSSRLELLDGMIQLYRLLLTLSTIAATPTIFYRSKIEELILETGQLACMTLEAINYLHCCVEGVIAGHIPWDIVKRYSERKQRETS